MKIRCFGFLHPSSAIPLKLAVAPLEAAKNVRAVVHRKPAKSKSGAPFCPACAGSGHVLFFSPPPPDGPIGVCQISVLGVLRRPVFLPLLPVFLMMSAEPPGGACRSFIGRSEPRLNALSRRIALYYRDSRTRLVIAARSGAVKRRVSSVIPRNGSAELYCLYRRLLGSRTKMRCENRLSRLAPGARDAPPSREPLR